MTQFDATDSMLKLLHIINNEIEKAFKHRSAVTLRRGMLSSSEVKFQTTNPQCYTVCRQPSGHDLSPQLGQGDDS